MNPDQPPKDHVDEPGGQDAGSGMWDDEDRARASGKRLLFMLVMAIIFSIGVTVGTIVILLQFFWVLFTGETKREFSLIGRQLAEYSRQIGLYMTFNTEDRPFPFDLDWPSVGED